MAGSCNINCSAPPPPYIPDSDISGTGVIVNYVATAGLAVLMVIVYYVTVYDSSIDPFDTAREGALSDHLNPLDDLLLRWLRSGPAYISKRLLGSPKVLSPRARSRLERVLIKCILLMSDIQIVTGFAILLSGFAQFQCGLAALKWRIILDLAWFSCLTHLTCLTTLRRYLYAHTFERIWRLFAMGILAGLLAAGLLITANPRWLLLSEDTKATPAICIVGCYLKPGPDKEWVESMEAMDMNSWQPSNWFWAPIVSAIFIVVAFASRVVRLHKFSSVGVSRATKWFDGQMQRFLQLLFSKLCKEADTIYSLKRALRYRPLFGIVMMLRFGLDSWASFTVEVSWVFVAFLWEFIDFGQQVWTFGQIVSIFTLAAPLISIVGTLEESKKGEDPSLPQQPLQGDRLPLSCTRPSTPEDLESPDTCWAAHSYCLGTAAIYIYATSIFVGASVFVGVLVGSAPLNTVNNLGAAIPMAVYNFYFVVLCSLTAELLVPQDRYWLQMSLQFLIIGLFLTNWCYNNMLYSESNQNFQFFAPIGLYILGCLVHRAVG